jgi:hypothetical protein
VSLIAVGVIGAVFFGTAGSASASKTTCSGQLGKSVENPKSKSDLSYSFSCNQNIIAYTLSFTKQIVLFGPEVLPTLPTGEASGELVSCEGDIPTSGIGCTAQSSVCPSSAAYTACTGKVGANNTVKSEVETLEPFCPKQTKKDIKKGKKPKKPIKASLIVSSLEFTASGKTFVNSSLPFTFTNAFKCPKPKK